MGQDINRFEMKTSYQANMLKAMAITTVLTFVLLLAIGSSPTNTPISDKSLWLNASSADESINQAQLEIPPSENNGIYKYLIQARFGAKIKVVPDYPEPLQQKEAESSVLETSTTEDAGASVSPLLGGLLAGQYYIPELGIRPIAQPSKPIVPKITRDPRAVHRFKPNVPDNATKMNGYTTVEIRLLIDPRGRLANFAADRDGQKFWIDSNEKLNKYKYYFSKGSRKGRELVKYLYAVLPKWRFLPALEDGVAIYSFVIVKYTFCPSQEKDCSGYTLARASS